MADERARVVVITGASSGIGRATALKFAEQGWNLVVGARREKALETLAEHCQRLGVQAVPVKTDVTDEYAVADLAREALDEFGHFDVWVNNAGVATVGRFEEVPVAEHRRVVETDLLGTMFGCHVALQHFRERGRGVIVNISSVLGKTSHPYEGSYVASKHGVTALGIALRQELWLRDARKIHVCTVHPESTDTPFFDHAANHLGHQVKPVPPIDTPERVANVIYSLAMKPQDEVIVGYGGKLIAGQMKVAQALTAKLMAYLTEHRQVDRSRRTHEHSGSLFKPMSSGAGVRGGWKKSGSVGKRVASVLGAVVPIGAAAVVWGRKRKHQVAWAA